MYIKIQDKDYRLKFIEEISGSYYFEKLRNVSPNIPKILENKEVIYKMEQDFGFKILLIKEFNKSFENPQQNK